MVAAGDGYPSCRVLHRSIECNHTCSIVGIVPYLLEWSYCFFILANKSKQINTHTGEYPDRETAYSFPPPHTLDLGLASTVNILKSLLTVSLLFIKMVICVGIRQFGLELAHFSSAG